MVADMAADELIVHGAREHNLKDIDVRLPRNSLVCITGLSGSGKSSLAFDTIYAEGQRRYVESLSAYARQFLQMMEKPDVDSIDGLSPAISIDQKTTSRNPRSTVGTVTEIYDYLRLLYARVGRPHCPVCGRPIAGQSLDQIVEQILALPEGTKFTVNAPVVRDRKGEFRDVLDELRADGFTRVKVDGETRLLEEEIVLDKKFKHEIDVVVDRLVLKPDLRQRLTQSVETAAALADGLVAVDIVDGETMLFSEKFACPEHGVSLPELQPRIFSFNSPHGACPRCTGLGSQLEIDPDLIVPDPSVSIGDGALVPWSVGNGGFYDSIVQAICDRYEIDPDTPWRELSTEQQDLFLHGTKGDKLYVQYRNRMNRRRSYTMAFEGIVSSLERRYKETDSAQQRERIEEYMSFRPCPTCGGARLKPEVLAVTVGGESIHSFTRMSVTRALAFLDELGLTTTEELIGHRIVKEIRERLTFLDNVGVGYLQLDRAAKTLSGGEAQRLRLATQIGSQLVGVLYILDEPSIGLHQRDNDKLIGDARAAEGARQHRPRRRARRADDAHGRPPRRHGPRRRRAWRLRRRRRHREGRDAGQRLRHRPVPLRRAADRDPAAARGRQRPLHDPRRRRAQPEGHRRRRPRRQVRHRHRRLRLRQVDARERDPLQGAREPAQQDARQAGRARLGRGDRRLRQGDRDRPEADRADAALEPGDVHRPLHAHPRALSLTPEAKVRGYKPGRFSFNVRGGRCETCKGDGTIKIEMHFLPDVYVPCETCHGHRYNKETLEVRFKGKSIADVLEMSVEEALTFFAKIPKLRRRLQTLHDVGLDYIKLGQPATTLSGGEAQRVKLAAELCKVATGRTLYILDEPTTGLHFADIEKLLEVLQRLVDAGNTVLVIEHNLDVIKQADWVIDLGPEGGEAGGELIAAGTPEQVADTEGSFTGQFLRQVLAPRGEPVAA